MSKSNLLDKLEVRHEDWAVIVFFKPHTGAIERVIGPMSEDHARDIVLGYDRRGYVAEARRLEKP